jgi:hypothetical protein
VNSNHGNDPITAARLTQLSKNLSIYIIPNPLLNIPGFNVFTNPPCRMHSCDHGIFKKLLELVIQYAKRKRKGVHFDKRWIKLLGYPGLRRFPRGVGDLSFLKCHEYRDMSMCLPFVCHGIFESALPEEAAVCYVRWKTLLHKPLLSVSDLDLLDRLGKSLQALMQDLSRLASDQLITASVKFHKIGHWAACVRNFGQPGHYDGQTFESAHKVFVKPMRGRVNQSGIGAERATMRHQQLALVHRDINQGQSSDDEDDGIREWSLRNLTKQQTRLLPRPNITTTPTLKLFDKLYVPYLLQWIREGYAVRLSSVPAVAELGDVCVLVRAFATAPASTTITLFANRFSSAQHPNPGRFRVERMCHRLRKAESISGFELRSWRIKEVIFVQPEFGMDDTVQFFLKSSFVF